MEKRNNILNKIISYTPIGMFLLWVIIDFLTKGMTEEEYLTFYFKEVEFLKLGLLPNLFLLAVSFRYKLCYYNKVAIIGMILMNINALIAIGYGGESAYEWYTLIVDNILMVCIALLAIILLIRKT